jgi:hypothetical protein
MPQFISEFEELVQWFIQDINENLNWSDVDDISESRKREIARHKAKNLINYVNKGDKYEPFK